MTEAAEVLRYLYSLAVDFVSAAPDAVQEVFWEYILVLLAHVTCVYGRRIYSRLRRLL